MGWAAWSSRTDGNSLRTISAVPSVEASSMTSTCDCTVCAMTDCSAVRRESLRLRVVMTTVAEYEFALLLMGAPATQLHRRRFPGVVCRIIHREFFPAFLTDRTGVVSS